MFWQKSDIDKSLRDEIRQIDWEKYETAYGNAEKTIPKYLINLFSSNSKKSMQASHDLWCSLCHQHAYLSSAALPAYKFLRKKLAEGPEELQVEVLDIFFGYAVLSHQYINEDRKDEEFIRQIYQHLLTDKELFQTFTSSSNEDIQIFANYILEKL
jgi:hypothetical protein